MVSRRLVRFLGTAPLLVLPAIMQAQNLPPPASPVISDPSSLTAAYEALVGPWLAAVSPYAFDLFYALAALDIAVFGWNLWMNYNGDIRAALLATTNKVLILGFFLSLLMNGEKWMADIINMFITIGKTASGVPSLGPSTVLLQGFKIFGLMLGQATWSGALLDLQTAIALILAALLICFSFLAITFQFIVTKVQTFLALGMGYLFLGFGGSRWTAPYVERYFAYSVASGVKLMALYMLAGAGWSLTESWIRLAQAGPLSASSVESCWVIMCGAILYAGVCWYGSSQVSQLLGGSPSLTHSDFVAFLSPMVSAAVTGGLVAAGLATGGTTAVAGVASGAGAAGKGIASAASGGAAPSGASPPQSSPAGASGSGSGLSALGQMAQAGTGAVGRMPHGGHHAPPAHFQGFGHGH